MKHGREFLVLFDSLTVLGFCWLMQVMQILHLQGKVHVGSGHVENDEAFCKCNAFFYIDCFKNMSGTLIVWMSAFVVYFIRNVTHSIWYFNRNYTEII